LKVASFDCKVNKSMLATIATNPTISGITEADLGLPDILPVELAEN
jgi:hypothetical protein